MSNREIRGRAWELTRLNFGLILMASFVMSLFSVLGSEALKMMVGASADINFIMTASAVISLLTMIYSLLVSVGYYRLILDIWHEEPTGVGVLFQHSRRFGTLLAVSFLMVANLWVPVMAVILICTRLDSSILVAILIICLFIYCIRVALRLSPAITYIALRPEWKATQCLKMAWRASRRHAGGLFCHEFMLSLPLIAVEILLSLFPTLLFQITGRTLNDAASLILGIVTSIITIILTGYITLGNAGLHVELLKNYESTQQAPSLPETGETDEDSHII